MVKCKDFSSPLSVFQVLSRQILFSRTFKTVIYIQVLFKPVQTLSVDGDFLHFKLEIFGFVRSVEHVFTLVKEGL